MTKIVIEVRGGMVVSVLSHEPIEYAIVDWDNPNPEDIEVYGSDKVGEKIYELFDQKGETEVAQALMLNEF